MEQIYIIQICFDNGNKYFISIETTKDAAVETAKKICNANKYNGVQSIQIFEILGKQIDWRTA